MIEQITQWILETLRYYGGWSVFMGVLIEQIIIPIPSPAIIMGAGLILVPAGLPLGAALWGMTLKIVLPGTVASLLGAIFCYYLGLWGGRAFIDKFQRFLGFSWRDVEVFGRKMTTGGAAASLFFMRAIPIVPLSLVSVVAGVLEVKMSTFLLWSFLGAIPRCYILAALGWQLGSSAAGWAKGINRLESVMSVTIVGLVLGVIIYIRHRVRAGLAAETKQV